jgi:hypothetical protein
MVQHMTIGRQSSSRGNIVVASCALDLGLPPITLKEVLGV